MKYRHREYTVPPEKNPRTADEECARVVEIIRAVIEDVENAIDGPGITDREDAIRDAIRQIVFGGGAYPAPEPKVYIMEATGMTPVDPQPFQSVEPMTLEIHYDPDTFGDAGPS